MSSLTTDAIRELRSALRRAYRNPYPVLRSRAVHAAILHAYRRRDVAAIPKVRPFVIDGRSWNEQEN